jgi:DNA-binding transcriptional regulator LsrR (DeoR family)
MAGLGANQYQPEDLEYIQKMLYVYGFSKEFVARDLGIQVASLDRRIERAKEKGEWSS